jgi:RecA-family ATPase
MKFVGVPMADVATLRDQIDAARPASLLDAVLPDQDWQGRTPPERSWVVERMAPAGVLTLFSGDGGLGKSLLLQQLLSCVSLGKPWLGVNVKHGRALGYFCEDDHDELWRRQEAILTGHSAAYSDLGSRLAIMPRLGLDNALAARESRDGLLQPSEAFHALEQAAHDHQADIIGIDPSVAVFPGNEVVRTEVRRFCDLLNGLAHRTGAAVILTAHPSRAGLQTGDGYSGSTDWNNSVRSRWYLAKAGEDDDCERVITTPKANYAPTDERIELVWQDGVFVRTNGPADAVDRMQQASAETVFLECLQRAQRQGVNLSLSKHSGQYAPRYVSRMPQAKSFKTKALERAMHNLLDEGRIKNVSFGPPSKDRKRLEVVQ